MALVCLGIDGLVTLSEMLVIVMNCSSLMMCLRILLEAAQTSMAMVNPCTYICLVGLQ
jgi:hypothetical protein